MNTYKFFLSSEKLIKIIISISILIVLVSIFLNNSYFKILSFESKSSQINLPEVNQTSKINISEANQTPKINLPEVNQTPKINIPEVKQIPDSIAIIISKIISDENLNSNQILFKSYEDKEWNSYALGCPRNGEFYALSYVKGLKINIHIDGEENIIHADQNLNYVNCTRIKNENSNAGYNFYRQYDLENIKKITLVLNSSKKILSTLEDEEKVIPLIKSLDKDINVIKVDSCDSIYTLIFSNEFKNINFSVACEGNLNYVENEESLEITNLFVKILENLRSNSEFPGMPSNE